jgi:DegV family protein with EDD domain
MRIQYIDGDRLRRALLAGCEYVQLQRTELNRINVFPVPDGDTGTNLALTASSIAERLRNTRARSVGAVAHEAAEAGILGARGNCGMILSHFLLGFSESAGSSDRMDVPQFARALQDAVEHVYRALEKPVEGTIVTVMRETAEHAQSSRSADFAELIEDLLERAQESLARTPDLLPALRAAGVVDAGAKGFVHILEGVCAYVEGTPFVTLAGTPDFAGEAPAARAEFSASSEQYRFCTEALVRGVDLPTAADIRMELRERGDSLIVIRSANLLKLHIHTDVPDAIFDYLRTLGELATHKAEDMQAQHRAVEAAADGQLGLARRPMSIVSDTACDLPDEIILAHGINLVPLWVMFENKVMRDRFDIDAGEFAQRLRGGERGTTSQPAPADFLEGFRRAAQDGETVLAVLLASALSGTYSSAEAAAKRIDQARMVLFDSRAASLAQGLLVLKAAELAELGQTPEQIVSELTRVRDQSGIFFTVDVFDNLLASGRIGRGKVLIADLLDIKPILEIDRTGHVVQLAKVRGRANVLGRMLSILEKRVPRSAKQLRFGLVHVDCEQVLDEIAHELRRIYGERDIVRAAASPVLSTHIGPGAWGLAYQLEDEPL